MPLSNPPAGGGSALDASNNLLLPTATGNTTPGTGVALEGRLESGRSFPAYINPQGEIAALQETLARGTVQIAETTAGNTTLLTLTVALAVTGSTGSVSLATTSYGAARPRVAYSTGTTAGTTNTLIENARSKWRGNSAGRGGFLMSATFIPALLAGHALFIGLTSSTLAATPSSTSGTQHLGLLVETTDTLMSFSSRDGTTTTKVSTGLSSTSTSCLTLTLWCPANAGFVWARLYNEDTGALVSETQITLTLPATTTFLGFAQAVGNGALASNASVSFIRYYARFL